MNYKADDSKRKWLSRKATIAWCFVLGVPVLFFVLLYVLPEGYEAAKGADLCRSNLRTIYQGAVSWAEERTTNQLPDDFGSLSYELGAPKVLHCPADKSRPVLLGWSDATKSNVSYAITPVTTRDSTNVFVRCPYHHQAVTAEGKVIAEKR